MKRTPVTLEGLNNGGDFTSRFPVQTSLPLIQPTSASEIPGYNALYMSGTSPYWRGVPVSDTRWNSAPAPYGVLYYGGAQDRYVGPRPMGDYLIAARHNILFKGDWTEANRLAPTILPADVPYALTPEALRQELIRIQWMREHGGSKTLLDKVMGAIADITPYLATAALAYMGYAAISTAGAGAGAAAGSGSAATTTAATTAGTASISGAELVSLVEAGAVGAEGAFLEAAALSGSTIVYDTATGALLDAVLPSGQTVAFSEGVDALAQFGVEPSQITLAEAVPLETAPEVALTEEQAIFEQVATEWESAVAESAAQDATLEVLNALPAESSSIVQDVMQQLGIDTLMRDAGSAVVQQLTQMGQAALANEVRQLIGGGSDAAPGSYRAAQEIRTAGAPLPSGTTASRLTKTAVPLILGGGLGWLLMLVFADRN